MKLNRAVASIIAFLLPFGVVTTLALPPDTGALKLDISGLRSDDGVVHVMVYDSADAFNRLSVDGIARYAELRPRPTGTSFTFLNLKPGRYAVAIHHDENGNAAFDMENGVPTEGYAFSNNVGTLREPTFKEAGFSVTEDTKTLTLDVIYIR